MLALKLCILGLLVGTAVAGVDVNGPTRTVTIDNHSPRVDATGNIVNAHDGHIIEFNGEYWMYGTRYPECLSTGPHAQPHCGWGNGPSGKDPSDTWGDWGDNDYAVYSSTDLVEWELKNPQILPSHTRPHGTYFRPKVMHAPQNDEKERFVLWGNYVNMTNSGTDAIYFTAVAAVPQGPFTIRHWNITMGTDWFHNGDFNVFTDDDGAGYLVYHSYGCAKWKDVPDTPCKGVDGTHAVDLLSKDFTTSTRKTSGPFDIRGSEAAVMYRRAGRYYVITGTGCGFCTEGGDARPWVADHPLGPYKWTGVNLNPCRDSTDPNCGLMKQGISTTNKEHVVPAQQSFVFKLSTPAADGSEQWIWGGDRWNSTPDHLKSHEFQVWLPFKFGADNLPLPLKNLKNFDVEVPAAGTPSKQQNL